MKKYIDVKVETIEVGNPVISVSEVSLKMGEGKNRNNVWGETLESKEHLDIFLKGVKIACNLLNFPLIISKEEKEKG